MKQFGKRFGIFFAMTLNMTVVMNIVSYGTSGNYVDENDLMIVDINELGHTQSYELRLHFEDEERESDVVAVDIVGTGEAMKRYLNMYSALGFDWMIANCYYDTENVCHGKLLLTPTDRAE